MTFGSRVQGFRLRLSRWPQELGNRRPRDMPLPDWSGWGFRIAVGSVIDRELAEPLRRPPEIPLSRADSKEPAETGAARSPLQPLPNGTAFPSAREASFPAMAGGYPGDKAGVADLLIHK